MNAGKQSAKKDAAAKAYRLTESILRELEAAESFGVLNMAGGGMAADLAKYDKLDNAQAEMKELRSCLEEIQANFDDKDRTAGEQLLIEDSLRTADLFLDDVGSALQVLDKINEAKEQVGRLQTKIKMIQEKLGA